MASIKFSFGNHDPANLLYTSSPAYWCDYFIHLPVNRSSQFIVIFTSPLFKQMILQIIRGIQKPNALKVLSGWKALLKTLKVAL